MIPLQMYNRQISAEKVHTHSLSGCCTCIEASGGLLGRQTANTTTSSGMCVSHWYRQANEQQQAGAGMGPRATLY